MSEIKFACPHCGQHIACDGEFVSLDIECPSCGGTLVVPRIASAESRHPSTVIVASTPSPKHIPAAPAPHFIPRLETNPPSGTAAAFPPWLIGGLATLIVSFILRISNAHAGTIVFCLLAGAVVSGVLAAKDQRGDHEAGFQILRAICLAVIIIPALGIGILFLGCAAMCAAGH
jgi:hypothetical protein